MMLRSVLASIYRGPASRTFTIVTGTVLLFFLNLFIIYYFVQNTTDLNHAASTLISSTNETAKNKIDLYSCKISDPLAVNALARVQSESCRLRITEAACKLQNNVFHDKFPESACRNHDHLLIDLHVGCFVDSAKSRTLDGFTYEFKTDNSHEKCRAHCYRAGFLHYGLEFGRECFCGDSFNSTSLDYSECSYLCPGNSEQTCGGFNAIDIYRTGLKEKSIIPKAKYLNVSAATSSLSVSTTADPTNKEPVRIMFLLQLNGRNDRQVKRLLKAMYSPRHFYYIHVDQRQLYMLTEMKAVAAKLQNVYVAPDGHSTIWGGASLLSMVQDAIRRSMQLPHMADWDYLFNLSESDFPVMSLEELEAQLTVNRGKSFLASHGYNAARFIQKQGFDYVFLECEERMWRIGKREDFPVNLRLDGGSDWLVLHRDFAEYSISNQELPAKMRSLFSSIILPVESFFHTLAYNSPFCDSMVSSHLRLTNWNRKQGCRCASLKKVVDWCGCSPLVFKKAHAAKFALQKAIDKPFYVARKFESLIDIDPIAMAEAQALRDRSHLIQSTHPSFNSTFVNFYKADIDGYSLPNTLLAKSLLSMSSELAQHVFLSLLRIDIHKANAGAPHQMVFTIQVQGTLAPVQLLVERVLRGVIHSPAIVDGFQMKVIQFGINIDHKEEIFRGITAYSDLTGSPIVALRWVRVPGQATTVNETKTSPRVKFLWKDSTDSIVATQTLSPYDSIYGTQFAHLDLPKLSLRSSQAGSWTVVVQTPSISADPSTASELLASVHFPVFNPDDPVQFDSLTREYYVIKETCSSSDCNERTWSTFYPDPKSDIYVGYDSDLEFLV